MGNSASRRPRSRQQPAMADPSPAVSPRRPHDLSPDTPRKPALSPDQRRFCAEALRALKEKVEMPERITQEFRLLEKKRKGSSKIKRHCTIARDASKEGKNRHNKVLPFDDNRVVLTPRKDYRPAAGGYINASFITATKEKNKNFSQFIATQGPKKETYEDFWVMILQQRCPAIVMLTQLDYGTEDKCGVYFQEQDGRIDFGNIYVVTKWRKNTDTSLVLRQLEVNYKETNEPPMSVLHIQYPDWPDHKAPRDTIAVRKIFERINTMQSGLGPIVVHCSAGIGRTGTYCTIHSTLQRILVRDGSSFDLAKTIRDFRSQRLGMVETKDQYEFCYKAIIDELEDLISSVNYKYLKMVSNDIRVLVVFCVFTTLCIYRIFQIDFYQIILR